MNLKLSAAWLTLPNNEAVSSDSVKQVLVLLITQRVVTSYGLCSVQTKFLNRALRCLVTRGCGGGFSGKGAGTRFGTDDLLYGCLSLHHVSAIACTNDQIFLLSFASTQACLDAKPPPGKQCRCLKSLAWPASWNHSMLCFFFLVVSIGHPSLSNVSPKTNEHPTWP